MESLTATQHMTTDPVVTFAADDRATCVAYVRASHHRSNDTGGSDQTVHGCYTNAFERTRNGWRRSRVVLTASWKTGNVGVFGGLPQQADRSAP